MTASRRQDITELGRRIRRSLIVAGAIIVLATGSLAGLTVWSWLQEADAATAAWLHAFEDRLKRALGDLRGRVRTPAMRARLQVDGTGRIIAADPDWLIGLSMAESNFFHDIEELQPDEHLVGLYADLASSARRFWIAWREPADATVHLASFDEENILSVAQRDIAFLVIDRADTILAASQPDVVGDRLPPGGLARFADHLVVQHRHALADTPGWSIVVLQEVGDAALLFGSVIVALLAASALPLIRTRELGRDLRDLADEQRAVERTLVQVRDLPGPVVDERRSDQMDLVADRLAGLVAELREQPHRFDETGAVVDGFVSVCNRWQELSCGLRASWSTIHARERLLRGVIDAADHLGILLLRDDGGRPGRILQASQGASALFAVGNDALVGSELVQWIAERYRARWCEQEGCSAGGLDLAFLRGDGDSFPGRLDLRRLVAQETVHWVAVAQDLTQRRALEAQLRQHSKIDAIGQMASGIAHDFNNMLAGMLGYCDLVLLSDELGEKERSLVQRIAASGQRASGLTKQLLAFSRQAPTTRVVQRLSYLVEETVELLRRTVDPRVDIRIVDDSDGARVEIDGNLLQNALLNLGINARDAMPDGGELTYHLSVERLDPDQPMVGGAQPAAGRYVTVAVSDQGGGIPAELHERIFEPFFTTKAIGEGTGLGLAAVLGTVSEHGGYLRLATGPAGTTMRLSLPLIGGRSPQCSPILPPAPSGDARLVIVDDEELVGEVTQGLASSLGYRCRLFTDPATALQAFADGMVCDLVLLDWAMPELNGGEVFHRLRAMRPDLPVLLVTGQADAAGTAAVLAEARVASLIKPFDRRQLATALATLVDVRQALQE